MNNSIETQILRLVDEIAKDEKSFRYYREDSITKYSESSKKQSADTAKMYEESLERKIQLLKILKG